MTKSEWVENWLDSASKDLKVCESLFEKKHFDWCLFIGHLVVEKTLKALWIREHYPEPHPRIHNLDKLARKIPINLTDEQRFFLVKTNDFYLTGRYPEEKADFHKICTPEFTKENFEKIRKFYQWLLNQF
ncbi:HEPN domain-containing protein [candidate division KSB1 bacterium]|nr:HEPN domain-containing protein [candidate division KSB1 bacterium]